MTTLTTFPKFSLLPLELQRQIWFHALPPPSILTIKIFDGTFYQTLSDKKITQTSGWKLLSLPHTPPPSLLQCCHESREICKENGYHISYLSGEKGVGTEVEEEREKERRYIQELVFQEQNLDGWGIVAPIPKTVKTREAVLWSNHDLIVLRPWTTDIRVGGTHIFHMSLSHPTILFHGAKSLAIDTPDLSWLGMRDRAEIVFPDVETLFVVKGPGMWRHSRFCPNVPEEVRDWRGEWEESRRKWEGSLGKDVGMIPARVGVRSYAVKALGNRTPEIMHVESVEEAQTEIVKKEELVKGLGRLNLGQ